MARPSAGAASVVGSDNVNRVGKVSGKVWRAPKSGGYQPKVRVPEPQQAPRGSAGTSKGKS
jgi:hypothetical protein